MNSQTIKQEIQAKADAEITGGFQPSVLIDGLCRAPDEGMAKRQRKRT